MTKPTVVAFTANRGAHSVLLSDGTVWKLTHVDGFYRWQELPRVGPLPFRTPADAEFA